MLEFVLHDLVAELPADESLHFEDSILRVARGLVLGRVSDEALLRNLIHQPGRWRVREGHKGQQAIASRGVGLDWKVGGAFCVAPVR